MISQTAEYALRAMACLAYQPEKLTATPELAKMTRVPSNYLAKVLQMLAGAGLIQGRRGVGGGYQLSRSAGDIRLIDVVTAVDRVERITTCPLGLENHGATLCALHRRVDAAAKAIIDEFGSASLADVVEDGAPSMPLCDVDMTNRLLRLTLDDEEVEAAAGDTKAPTA
ncbi:MAG: Rrf2 family transcriptional regulator [Planctomycetota bacterium]